MEEAFVQLLCPECSKAWESTPRDLPKPAATFHCPNCHASRRMSEFLRTDRDLKILKSLQS